MSALYRHIGHDSLFAAYGGRGDGIGDNRSGMWLVRTQDGRMERPCVNSPRLAWCADCGALRSIGTSTLARLDNPATAYPPAIPEAHW